MCVCACCSHFEDILFTNWFVQVMTMFSEWFWLVYLWLPIYATYTYSSTCFGMLCGQREQQREPTEKELKKMEKKERKEKRMAKFAVRSG
jgi:hypothetical protein